MKLIKLNVLLLLIILPACSSLKLAPADFSWPVESVLKVNEDGFVKEDRYSLVFNSKNLFLEETGDSLSYQDKDLRIIRDNKGYYYITSNNFKNVYVFSNSESELFLEKKILITETGISKPAFNQRSPLIELVNGDKKQLLTNDGLVEEEENEE